MMFLICMLITVLGTLSYSKRCALFLIVYPLCEPSLGIIQTAYNALKKLFHFTLFFLATLYLKKATLKMFQ